MPGISESYSIFIVILETPRLDFRDRRFIYIWQDAAATYTVRRKSRRRVLTFERSAVYPQMACTVVNQMARHHQAVAQLAFSQPHDRFSSLFLQHKVIKVYFYM